MRADGFSRREFARIVVATALKEVGRVEGGFRGIAEDNGASDLPATFFAGEKRACTKRDAECKCVELLGRALSRESRRELRTRRIIH